MDNTGDGIAIYGPVGPNQTTSYVVTIDGSQNQAFSAYNLLYRSQQILFFTTGLGRGSHTVSMQLGGAGLGELAIDFSNIYTAPSLGGRSVILSVKYYLEYISHDINQLSPAGHLRCIPTWHNAANSDNAVAADCHGICHTTQYHCCTCHSGSTFRWWCGGVCLPL